MKDGLLVVYTGRESIKIGPPLSITLNALEEGVEIIERNLNYIFKKKMSNTIRHSGIVVKSMREFNFLEQNFETKN